MLSGAPPSFACASSFFAALSGAGSASSVAAIASFVTISVNPSEQSSKAIASLNFERAGLDGNSELLAADDVRDDVAETVPGDLVWPKGSAAHHVGGDRVVLGELVQLAVSVHVRTAVADVHDAQLRTQMKRHRHRRPHPAQFRMLRRLLENAGVGLTERRLELREDLLRFAVIRAKEPLERIERELLDRDHGEGARAFASPVPAHAVSHEKQMCVLLANLTFGSGRLVCQTRIAFVSSAIRN